MKLYLIIVNSLAYLSFLGTLACKTSHSETLTDTSELNAFGGPADEDAIRPSSSQERDALIRRSPAYTDDAGSKRGDRTLLEGPYQYKYKKGKLDRIKYREFELNQVINCDYIDPWQSDKPGGKTAKFACNYQYESGGQLKTKSLKVKYDSFNSSVNTGIYGEVLGTRLLWALGFPVDTVIPVQVRCMACPFDPWSQVRSYWSIHSDEEYVARLAKDSPEYATAADRLLASKAQLISQTLSQYQAYQDVSSSKLPNGSSYGIYSGAKQLLFSTEDGLLRLPNLEPMQLMDPSTGQLRSIDRFGNPDFALTTLISEALKDSPRVTRDFVSALIEWKHNSLPIETYDHEGWSFNSSPREKPGRTIDIRNVDPANRELVIQRQELALLASFIAHADNKAEQQRFICLDPDKIEQEDDDCKVESKDPRDKRCAAGTDVLYTSCNKTAMMIQDLGFVMGYGAKLLDEKVQVESRNFDSSPTAKIYGTANAEGFLNAPLFKDAQACITTVNEWATGVEIEEAVSDEARLRLVKKLQTLADNDRDLTDLFRSARLHLLEMHAKRQEAPALVKTTKLADDSYLGGTREQALVEQWKVAFRSKVSQLAKITCPTLAP